MLFLILEVRAEYNNPQYLRSYTNPDGTHDTIAIISFSSDPAFMASTTADVKYISQYNAPEGLYLQAGVGNVCKCMWQGLDRSFPSPTLSGDTVSFSFTFTPQVIGEIATGIVLTSMESGSPIVRIPVRFTLDEYGNAVKEEIPRKIRYGGLGLHPDIFTDSLVFLEGCFESETRRNPNPGRGFSIRAVQAPPFNADQPSTMKFTIVSYHNFERGVSFALIEGEQFEILEHDLADWELPVFAGDTLRIEFQVKVVGPGSGFLGIQVTGHHSLDPLRRTHEKRSTLRVEFFIDPSLSIQAYSSEAILLDKHFYTGYVDSDSARWPELRLLHAKGVLHRTIYSQNYQKKRAETSAFRKSHDLR